MTTLESYGREIHSVFQLLGDKENDITLSMSWALAQCPEFLKAVVQHICGLVPDTDTVMVMNQKYDAATGITDIEVTDEQSFHIIFEAKRGWDFARCRPAYEVFCPTRIIQGNYQTDRNLVRMHTDLCSVLSAVHRCSQWYTRFASLLQGSI